MMPLKKAVRADEGSSASSSPRHPPAWDEQVRVDVCEVDVDDTYAFRAPCLFTKSGCVSCQQPAAKGVGL
jgi:hypothetical protein